MAAQDAAYASPQNSKQQPLVMSASWIQQLVLREIPIVSFVVTVMVD